MHPTETRDAIEAALQRLESDWNRGDMEAYLDAYWRDPALRVVSGAGVLEGWDALAARYRTAWPDPRAMGSFTVGEHGLQEVAPQLWLAAGVFEHRFPEIHVEGAFTQLYRYVAGSWRIAHEHTSRGLTRAP